MLRALNPEAQAVFDFLIADLSVGVSLKLDNAKGGFIAVHVEQLTERHYSVAHYHEQNGDQMADPEMTFFKSEDGKVYPCTFQQDCLGVYRIGLDITEEGVIEAENAKEQADLAEFAELWMRNITEQQQLPCKIPEENVSSKEGSHDGASDL